MRNLRSSLMVFAAVLYVLLGISASRHAPHFSRGEAAIGLDAHGGEHEIAPNGESCALCSTKKSAQETTTASVESSAALECGSAPRALSGLVAGQKFRNDRARAPPASPESCPTARFRSRV